MLEFPPLPPSPVEEADEESSDVNVAPVSVSTHYGSHRAMSRQPTRTIEYRPRVPPHRVPTIDMKDHRSSLDTTRSMDAGYSRSRRTPNAPSNSRRDVSALDLFFFTDKSILNFSSIKQNFFFFYSR